MVDELDTITQGVSLLVADDVEPTFTVALRAVPEIVPFTTLDFKDEASSLDESCTFGSTILLPEKVISTTANLSACVAGAAIPSVPTADQPRAFVRMSSLMSAEVISSVYFPAVMTSMIGASEVSHSMVSVVGSSCVMVVESATIASRDNAVVEAVGGVVESVHGFKVIFVAFERILLVAISLSDYKV